VLSLISFLSPDLSRCHDWRSSCNILNLPITPTEVAWTPVLLPFLEAELYFGFSQSFSPTAAKVPHSFLIFQKCCTAWRWRPCSLVANWKLLWIEFQFFPLCPSLTSVLLQDNIAGCEGSTKLTNFVYFSRWWEERGLPQYSGCCASLQPETLGLKENGGIDHNAEGKWLQVMETPLIWISW
jgi:hypothetical protein